MKSTALIVGAGNGLSHSLTRLLLQHDSQLALAARTIEKLAPIANDRKASTHRCDIASEGDVKRTFEETSEPVRVAICNPSAMVRGPLVDLDPSEVADAIAITAFNHPTILMLFLTPMPLLKPICRWFSSICLRGRARLQFDPG